VISKGTLFALGFLILISGLYAVAPFLIENWVVSYLASQAVLVKEISLDRPGFNSIEIQRIHLLRGNHSLAAENIFVTYDLSEIDAGRVTDITIGSLVLTIGEQVKGDNTVDVVSPWEIVPARRVQIDAVTLINMSPEATVNGRFVFETDFIESEATLQSPLLPEDIVFQLNVEPDGTAGLSLSAPGQRPAVEVKGHKGAGDRFAFEADLNIEGDLFTLVAEQAGLRQGAGYVRGGMSGSLPWPLVPIAQPQDIKVSAALDTKFAGSITDVSGVAASGDIDITLADSTLMLASDSWKIHADEMLLAGELLRLTPESRAEGTFKASFPLTDGLTAIGTIKVSSDFALDLAASGDSAEAAAITAVRGQFSAEFSGTTLQLHIDSGAALVLSLSHQSFVQLETPLNITHDLSRNSTTASATTVSFAIPAFDFVDDQTLSFPDPVLHSSGSSFVDGLFVSEGTFLPVDSEDSVAIDYRIGFQPEAKTSHVSLNIDQVLSRPLVANELTGWQPGYDLDGGHLKLVFDGTIDTSDDLLLNGNGVFSLDEGTAHGDDTIATGIETRLPFSISAPAFQIGPGTVKVAELEAGLPFTDIQFDLTSDAHQLQISHAIISLLGSMLSIEDLLYDTGTQRSNFQVEVRGLPVANVLALEGDDVTGTGVLDGQLPVALTRDGVSIASGTLTSRPPGGYLSYRGDAPSANPGLDLAITALRNFNYESMVLDVNYMPDGELRLLTRLQGSSPDVEEGRAIHFNLNINENIPSLFESLRASSDLPDRVQQRLSQ
jgi:hypothetical protein